MTAAPPRLMTAEELFALPDDGRFWELDEGRLVEDMPSALSSSVVGSNVLVEVSTFVRARRLGIVTGEQGGMKLSSKPDTVRAPDMSFIRRNRLPGGRAPNTFFDGAPDLAVEVLSPSDSLPDIMRKVEQYLHAGTRLAWVIDPVKRTVAVCHRGAIPDVLRGEAVLDGEDVLPGFTLPLARLWEGLDDLEDDDAPPEPDAE